MTTALALKCRGLALNCKKLGPAPSYKSKPMFFKDFNTRVTISVKEWHKSWPLRTQTRNPAYDRNIPADVPLWYSPTHFPQTFPHWQHSPWHSWTILPNIPADKSTNGVISGGEEVSGLENSHPASWKLPPPRPDPVEPTEHHTTWVTCSNSDCVNSRDCAEWLKGLYQYSSVKWNNSLAVSEA